MKTLLKPRFALLYRLPVLLAVVCAVTAPSQAAEAQDPWSLLGELRDNLGGGSQQASFVQIYRPAGFTTGDRETGHLYLSLPDCVRWDYEDPYPKTFLLCRDTIHTWNPGDQAGRRFLLVDSDEPGIDLLRLQIDDLRLRYEARTEKGEDGSLQVILSPHVPSPAIAEARLTIEPSRQVLSILSYRDQEGNTSRFEITDYEPHEDASYFEPPADLEWLDQ